MSRAPELCRARVGRTLSEEDCLIWLGVGLATLERVEAGELVPGSELERRIDRFLSVFGGGFFPFSSANSRPSFTHGEGHLSVGAAPCGPGAPFEFRAAR